MIDKVLRRTGIDPATIGYVEAHGTGTSLGDPIEFAALKETYGRWTDQRGFCALGSVKTNIGHLDTAAGLAGCIKLALSLERGEIPPTLNFTTPNPRLELETSPFYIADKLETWPSKATPRRGAPARSALAGQTRMRSWSRRQLTATPHLEGPWIVPLSARDQERLAAYAGAAHIPAEAPDNQRS